MVIPGVTQIMFRKVIRIDYVFISSDFIYNVDKQNRSTEGCSKLKRSVDMTIIRRIPGKLTSDTRLTDHRLLKFSVKLSDAKRGPGYWKLNTSFLENNEYKGGVRYIIDIFEYDESATNTWETLKTKTKYFSISFAKYYHKDINKNIGFGKTDFGYRKFIIVRYQYEQKAGIRKSAK